MNLTDNIADYLQQWFWENDSLVIPRLGKFEAQYVPATMQHGLGKFSPPNKVLNFNPFITENDGVLEDFISRAYNIDVDTARVYIQEFVDTIYHRLHTTKRYRVEGFGTFNLMPDESVQFVVEQNTNFLGDSFGLNSVFAQPSTKLSITPAEPSIADRMSNSFTPNTVSENTSYNNKKNDAFESRIIEQDIKVEKEVLENENKQLFYWFALGVVLLTVIFSFLIMTNFDPLNSMTNADTTKKSVGNDKPELKDTTKNVHSAEEVIIENPPIPYTTDDSFVRSFAFNPTTPAIANVIIKNKTNKYYVVLASFDRASNAYSYYNNLRQRGVSSAVVIAPSESNVRYRVAMGEYLSRTEARKQGYAFGSKNKIAYFIYKY